jgi:hypothetical protein
LARWLKKAIVSELAGLGKTVYVYFNEDVVIVDKGCKLVLLHVTAGITLTGILVYSYCSMDLLR